MYQGMFRAGALFLTILAGFALANAARASASAAPATCPAQAGGFIASNPQRTLYGFRVTPLSARGKLSRGQIAVDTSRGWFRMLFPGAGTFYAHFYEPVIIRNAWVENIGAQTCYPTFLSTQSVSASERAQLGRGPGPRDVVVQATIREPYGRSDCSLAFQPPRALTVVEPAFAPKQATFAGVAQIDVMVLADGKVGDAKVVQTSGTADFDDAAVDAARKSTYAPALAYCLPAAAHYIYKASLKPLG